ncbi:MAG: hypothetical protein GPI96_12010 [Microcystis aeruginosa BS13-02]|nr:hypothetical protein [Microcystis aeruginosa BS13-02]
MSWNEIEAFKDRVYGELKQRLVFFEEATESATSALGGSSVVHILQIK